MPNEELRERNIETVIRVTEECFRLYGIEATRIDMVAEKSKISERSIFRYFNSKDKLTYTVIDRFLDSYYIKLRKHLDMAVNNDLTGIEQVRLFFKKEIDFFEEQYVSIMLLSETRIYIYKNEFMAELSDKDAKNIIRITEILQQAVEKGIKDGTIDSNRNANETANLLYTMYSSMLTRMTLLSRLTLTGNGTEEDRKNVGHNILEETAQMLLEHIN